MATRTNRVEVEITATDEASPKIDRLEQKIDGLESDEARIIVSANTDRLQKQLDDARTKLVGLDGDEATVQARLVGTLEQDLQNAQQLLNRLDGQTGTVRITARDTASADIDHVQAKLRALDGTTARTGLFSSGGKKAAAAGGAAAVGAFLFDAVTTANELAGEVQQVADATGAPLEQASRLVTVWKQNGFEVSDLLDIIFQVNGALAQNPELAGQLGVELGENQSLIDTFLQSVEGVGTAYENVADRQVAASQLFGEEGVRQIGAVTTAVGDLDTAMANLPDAQLIDPADVERWRQTNEKVVELKGNLQETQLLLAEAFLPMVLAISQGIAAWFTGASDFGNWVANQGGDFRRWLTGSSSNLAIPPSFVQTPQGPQQPQSAYTGQGQSAYAGIHIYNPPGTPAATVDNARIYQRRNGIQ